MDSQEECSICTRFRGVLQMRFYRGMYKGMEKKVEPTVLSTYDETKLVKGSCCSDDGLRRRPSMRSENNNNDNNSNTE